MFFSYFGFKKLVFGQGRIGVAFSPHLFLALFVVLKALELTLEVDISAVEHPRATQTEK